MAITGLGQVFTPPPIVERVLSLRRNFTTILEPAAGDGAFLFQDGIPKHFPEYCDERTV